MVSYTREGHNNFVFGVMKFISLVLALTIACLLCIHVPGYHSEIMDQTKESIIQSLNATVDPCSNFYEYACGGWIARKTLPATESRFVRSFGNIEKYTKTLLEAIVNNSSNTAIHNFYKTCLDTEKIEEEGIEKSLLFFNFIRQHIGQSTSTTVLKNTFEISGYLARFGIPTFLSFSSEIDRKGASKYIARVSQSGIVGLPTTVYASESAKNMKLKEMYKKHISSMFKLLNYTNAEELALEAFTLETELASIMLPRKVLRDPFKSYNKYSRESLSRELPGIDWDAYFSAIGTNPQHVNVAALDYLKGVNDRMASMSVYRIYAYVSWRLLTGIQSYMPEAFRTESFNFHGRILSGMTKQPPRSEQCLKSASESLGFAIGKIFVENHFSEIAKEKAVNLVHDIKDVMRQTITEIDWMDAVTKTRALQKLKKGEEYIGRPNDWDTEDDVEVTGSYFDNKMNFNLRRGKIISSRPGQPISKHLWNIPPQTVNAFYSPSLNSINLPAAILSTPFFNEEFPIEMNYGGIGFVISHEILHGFDNIGRLYDGDGNLKDWWTPEVSDRYLEKAQCLVNQYNAFEPLPGEFLDGTMTLGENIADVAGMKELYAALQHRFEMEGIDGNMPSAIENLSHNQLFFVAFAQAWCTVERSEETSRRLQSDVHSPPKHRVIGTLQNSPHFAEVFQCPVGSYMNPGTKCEIF